MMEQEKIKAYYQMWSEAWAVFRRWLAEFQDDESFWQRVYRDAESYSEKYKQTDIKKFADRIIIGIAEELERVAKERGSE